MFKRALRTDANFAVYALQHQFFTAASWHVFVIYACMLGCVPAPSYMTLHHDAQRGLLTCLGGLAAIATSQVHARRSYLMVVLLMKRWGIRLNPAHGSLEADNLFQQTKASGSMANNNCKLQNQIDNSNAMLSERPS